MISVIIPALDEGAVRRQTLSDYFPFLLRCNPAA